MPDYEDLILQRQEEIEVYEDDYDSWRLIYGKEEKSGSSRRDPEHDQ